MPISTLPKSYNGVPFLDDELLLFYEALNNYDNDKTVSNELEVQRIGDMLFFTIKHRRLEGYITASDAEGLLNVLRQECYDRF